MKERHVAFDFIDRAELVRFNGAVRAVGQNRIDAFGPLCAVGDFCEIETNEVRPVLAQVVAVARESVSLLPLGPIERVRVGATVTLSPLHSRLHVGEGFAGRAVDAFGAPIDGKGSIAGPRFEGLAAHVPEKMNRTVCSQRVETGIRVIDGLIPIAKGQRIGIFAASGVGKTTLIEQLSSRVDCDHCIICQIGERGREVERLWRMHTSSTHAHRYTMVAATSDESATARVRAMEQALALAEHWRALGRHVVLLVDSMTRLAMALREIGLAANEPPALRSYTPNVFAAMPRLIERCGADRSAGQITAIVTVLAETDDMEDPIVELLKSLLDGHIVLSRRLAERNHYPAIDVGMSVSRVANDIIDEASFSATCLLRRHVAEFDEARPMIESGIYRAGSNVAIDRAIELYPHIEAFLQQGTHECSNLAETGLRMRQIVERQ